MFSRKKTNPLAISIDAERRDSFRVEQSKKEPIDVSIGRSKYHVKDLSAGGIGIYSSIKDKELEMGKEYPFKMTLPLINEVISGIIRIVDISGRILHCTFIGFGNKGREKIHLFVLERQKEELREKKKT